MQTPFPFRSAPAQRPVRRLVFHALAACLLAGAAAAAWEHDDHAIVFEPLGDADAIASCADGSGGLLVAMFDDAAPGRVLVSRLDHTGNELWGDGGIAIPFDMTSAGKAPPLAVAPDGEGGAYVAYRELYPGGQHILFLTRVRYDGAIGWTHPAEDFVADSDALMVFAVPTTAGDVILVWTQNHQFPGELLMAAKYRDDATRAWRTQVSDQVHLVDGSNYRWQAASDGADGVLAAYQRKPFLGAAEWRVQRIDVSGLVRWGANGTQLWTNSGEVAGVLADGSGGALLVNDLHYGEVWTHRVAADGSAAWPAGGALAIDLNTAWIVDRAAFCGDGAGGLIVVTGCEDLHAQRVDASGVRRWAGGMITGVPLTTLAGWQEHPTVCADGAGGALVVYRDHYWSDASDLHNQTLSGCRIDPLGNLLWSEQVLWWSGWQDGLEPWWPRAVSDETGGALVSWLEQSYGPAADDVRAMSVGPDGAVPGRPSLECLAPDAGSPGSFFTAWLLGDYLDAADVYTLERPDAPAIALDPVLLVDPRQLALEVDLDGAALGGWDLVVARAGVAADTLRHAFGVGWPPPCQHEGIIESGATTASNGSRRKVIVDLDGVAHAFSLVYDGVAYRIDRHDYSQAVNVYQRVHQAQPGESLSDLCAAIGPDDRQHVVAVVDNIGLRYFRFGPDGAPEVEAGWTASDPIHHPALAVSAVGEVRVVVVEDRAGGDGLVELVIDGAAFDGPFDLAAGTGTTMPDLMPFGPDGFVLAWVRDFCEPGFQEVCYRIQEGGLWGAIQAPCFGVAATWPSIAWDGVDTTLLAFIIDNTGSAPLLHTCRIEGGVAGPVRWRYGLPELHRTVVAAFGEEAFYLLTEESASGPDLRINLRWGDGRVFYPQRRLNSHTDVSWPTLGARGPVVHARWDIYNAPGETFGYYHCRWGEAVDVPDADRGLRALAASPNPFNPATVLSFDMPRRGAVDLAVHDVAGRRVATILTGTLPAGPHEVRWDGRTDDGGRAGSGIYLVRLVAPGSAGTQVAKVTLLK